MMRVSCGSSVLLGTILLWSMMMETSLAFCSIRAIGVKRHLLLSQQHLLQAQKREWSIADDWNTHSENENRPAESRDIFHQDIVGRAAFHMQVDQQHTVYSNETLEHDSWMSQVVQDIHPDAAQTSTKTINNNKKDNKNQKLILLEEEFEPDNDEEVLSHSSSSLDEEVMSQEIAQLIRCNEEPEQFLIQLGRAVSPLTEEERHDVRQLITFHPNDEEASATSFFQQAVNTIFDQYAKELPVTNNNNNAVEEQPQPPRRMILDKPALALWLQRSLSIPCGPHDSRVTKLTSTFGKYGQGYLELDDFQTLYFQAVVGGDKRRQASKGTTTSTSRSSTTKNTPPSDPTTYYYKRLIQQRAYEIDQVWKDLEIHGVESPALVDWKERVRALEQELQQQTSSSSSGGPAVLTQNDPSVVFHDECEILDSADNAGVDSWTQNKETGTWKRTGKSSHEKIDLCKCSGSGSDNTKIPIRFKDGDFVYIDEESCIGCTQCALAAPGSFSMLENGRARTFQQDTSPAVAAAVTTCPVNCMHYVGYDRLVELERARDDGILPSRPGDTHRHFGTKQTQATPPSAGSSNKKKNEKQQQSEGEEASQWIAHTPLYVSRMQSSDANHKESIYHYLRNQCYKSSACPQKGCYDCPIYASNPTSNPHWQRRVKEAYHVRAQHFQEHTNLADAFRKKAEL